MSFIKKIFLSIVISNNIKKIVKPYFNEINDKLSSFLIIDINTPKEVSDCIKEALNNNQSKYLYLKRKLININELIKTHNVNINVLTYIKDNRNIFDYEKIINNPFILENENFNNINTSLKYSKDIKNLPLFPIDLYKLEYIINNYKELCKQYTLKSELEHNLALDNYGYIDSNVSLIINNKINEIVNKIDLNNLFYDEFKNIDIDKRIKTHNDKWINCNLSNKIFDNVNDKSLDDEQRKSALIDELSTLVVAGAGSGKTLTICGKIKYILENNNVNPNEILLLSYSHTSSVDLQEKINKISDLLTVGTFHKIGLDILKKVHNKKFMIEEQYDAIVEKYFREVLKTRPNVLQKVLLYYALYINSNNQEEKYSNDGEMFEDLKKLDFTTLKNQLESYSNNQEKKETIKKELVKSYEELAIANWYFINGIDYIYEAPYKYDVSTPQKRQYTPDFYLPKYDIYHEHYGVNKDNTASQYSASEAEKYLESMNWKKQTHYEYNTTCIETYSWEFKDGIVFDKLEEELKNKGVVFNPLSQKQIQDTLESIYYGQSFKSFINLIKTFLSLYKSKFRDANGFDDLLKGYFCNKYEMTRTLLFIDIVKDLYGYYYDYLRSEGKIDFDDMILQSAIDLDKSDGFKFKYIIVDEFQDISYSRMVFLKKLINHGNSKLLAVGDDWQAIYRFSGCDLNIFLDFKKYFGPTEHTMITTTYRNSQELQNVFRRFMEKNPEQLKKEIKSPKSLKNPVQIYYYKKEKYKALLKILNIINNMDEKASVLLLGRNNKDIDSILLDNRIYIDNDKRKKNDSFTYIKVKEYPNMNIKYCTAHSSKGIEDDYVIIINADDSRLGFPNKVEDDEILNLVLSSKSGFKYAEERRLWYVAGTRTRNYVYIISSATNPSIFVKEIEEDCYIINDDFKEIEEEKITCPFCKSGHLVLRNNESSKRFYGCSNYPYCNYIIDYKTSFNPKRRCKRCGDFLLLKNGKYGKFYGCHSYPRCDYKEKYN